MTDASMFVSQWRQVFTPLQRILAKTIGRLLLADLPAVVTLIGIYLFAEGAMSTLYGLSQASLRLLDSDSSGILMYFAREQTYILVVSLLFGGLQFTAGIGLLKQRLWGQPAAMTALALSLLFAVGDVFKVMHSNARYAYHEHEYTLPVIVIAQAILRLPFKLLLPATAMYLLFPPKAVVDTVQLPPAD